MVAALEGRIPAKRRVTRLDADHEAECGAALLPHPRQLGKPLLCSKREPDRLE